MAFLADLKRTTGGPGANPLLGGIGKKPSANFARALNLPTTPLFPTTTAKKADDDGHDGTFKTPLAKSAIEILLELERKQEEEERLRGGHDTDDDEPTTRTTIRGKQPLARQNALPVPQAPKAAPLEDMVKKRRPTKNGKAKKVAPPTKNPTLEEMMKSRQAAADTTGAPRNAMLEEMMKKRNASKSGGTPKKEPPKNAMLEEMMQKRAPSTPIEEPPTPVPEEPPPAPASRNAMLEEMMRKRAPATEEPAPTPPSRNAMLEEMMKKRAPAAPAVEETSPAPSSRNAMLEEMMKQRAPAAEEPAPAPSSRNAMLEEMMKKRAPAAPAAEATPPAPSSRNAMLEEMMKKRAPAAPPADEPAPPASRNAMLEEMMKKRAPAAEEPAPSSRNAMLEEMMKKRAPAAPASGGGKNAMLEEMMKKRAPAAAAEEVPAPSRNAMLEEMMKKRAPAAPASGGGKNAMLEEMMKKRGGDTPEATPEEAEASAAVPLRDDPKYSKYFLMLKRGLPRPAVQHKMIQESVDPNILDMDPNLPFKLPTLAEDPVYSKYYKMLKTGLPKEVVQHKLAADGISARLLDLDPSHPTVPKNKIDEAFRQHQLAVIEKYKIMLKRGLPEPAVQHKMKMDGVDPNWLYPEKAPAIATGANFARRMTKPDSIRKKLHWFVLSKDNLSGNSATLWKQTSQVQLSTASVEALEKTFVKSLKEDEAPKPKNFQRQESFRGGAPSKISLLDMKKAQNIAITLARIKIPFDRIKTEILDMNPTIMSSMHLKALIDLWPDDKEMDTIRKYPGDVNMLGTAERFCHEMRDTPRFTDKMHCLVYKQEFPSRSHELHETILLVQRCVHQICDSTELRDILLLVLRIGNLLNFGKEAEETQVAPGFSLSSLVKLSQTKAFIGQTTLLQFLVETVDRDAPELAKFEDEIGLLERASRILIPQLHQEKKALETGHALLVAEAEKIEDEEGEGNLTAAAIRNFADKSEMELKDLTHQLSTLADRKKQFLEYFGEQGDYELDEMFSALWAFTEEFRVVHRKFLLKKARSKAKPAAAECA
ncbi:formin-homology 2 domain-containing protein [Achlya hypogyna]|uniref:Formin-homology 2 domain-containing protein n=1 Tax=Achlya hypogyna TaxID=1202772 RepID=A0A1V9YL23_ACHHY|nr:formin-homology 2 domain-containing protein [Achlya hypogyna]